MRPENAEGKTDPNDISPSGGVWIVIFMPWDPNPYANHQKKRKQMVLSLVQFELKSLLKANPGTQKKMKSVGFVS